MNLKSLQTSWEEAASDPLWAVLMEPEKRGGRWEAAEFFGTGEREINEIIERLHRLSLSPAGTALDFGCGVGRLTQALAGHFVEVTGVDISPTMIQYAQEFNRFPSTCRYVLNDTTDLGQFQNGKFDFIYSNIALQHIPVRYALEYLQEFKRVLVPGGIVVFQVVDISSLGFTARLRFRFDRLREQLAVRTRLRGQTPVALYAVPEDAVRAALRGLQIVDVRVDGRDKTYVAVSPRR